MSKKFHKIDTEDEVKNTGFSARNVGSRSLNKDGSFNVERRGLPPFRTYEAFHSLIKMSWTRFCLILLSCYVVLNILFAFLYLAAGIEKLDGAVGISPFDKFMDAFFFSAQTFTTVGYGKMSPTGYAANLLSALESMTGLLSFALATGLLYGRFSRPISRVIYSENAIIAPYKDITAFMFRVANARSSQLIDSEARLTLSMNDKNTAVLSRKFYTLKLEFPKIGMMPLSWTIVHPIDENSPLYGVSEQELADWDAEFLIVINSFDDTFSQQVHSRSSYKYHELVWGAKFSNIYGTNSEGVSTIALDKIGQFDRVELPVVQTLENS